jgi:NAD(P)-dependent dehydrogenase (short-subunit alcohol dehydrogenase family)
MSEAKRFDGQVAIVTGGAMGIGRAVAERLGREGARVCIVDRDAAALEMAHGAMLEAGLDVETHVADVSIDTQVAAAIEGVGRRHGRIDVLVHCAGIVGPNGRPVTQVEPAEFDHVYAVNLRSSFLVLRYVLPRMQERNYGRVLLFASIAGKEGNAGMCVYSATKAAVIGLVKSVGKELAETGVTVNAIAPAVVRTALVDNMEPSQVKYMTDKIPMKRCGTLEEIAAMTAWIVSPECSFTTGFAFDASGGRATY